MHKYFFILFLTFFSRLASQLITTDQLISNPWTKVKVRAIDGSKDLSEITPVFLQWKFVNGKLCNHNSPILINSKTCLDYRIEKNFIKISSELTYEIEKLNSDSLIVIERIKDRTENDKTRRIWFTNSLKIKNVNIEKSKNQKSIIANENMTPLLTNNFIIEVNKTFLEEKKYPNFKLAGNIIIFPKDKKVELEIQNEIGTKDNLKNVEILKSIITNSYSYWNVLDFTSFDTIYIPYVFESKSHVLGRESSYIYMGSDILYFTNNLNDINKPDAINLENFVLSNENFNKALLAADVNNYKTAIQLFEKSYQLNYRNTNALYNLAEIYTSKNDMKNACAALKKLKDLEQTDGTKMFNEKCTNINP